MFFENENHQVRFLEAFGYTDAKRVCMRVSPRSFSTLSIRLAAEGTVLKPADGEAVALGKGDILFIPAGLGYERRTDKDEVMVIHFENLGAPAFKAEKYTPGEPEKYEKLFSEIIAASEKNVPGRKAACHALFYTILSELAFDLAKENRGGNRGESIRPALDAIGERYLDPDLSVAWLASLCGMSEVTFRTHFTREMGGSPKAYLLKLRIEKAISLLEASYYSLPEIAERTGFCDVKYFGTVFRRMTGMTPGHFRIGECKMDTRWKQEECRQKTDTF